MNDTNAKIAIMKVKTEWDLRQLYTSGSDPTIERDVKKYERAYAAFEKKYRKSVTWQKSPLALAKALQDYEHLADVTGSDKPLLYFGYRHELNSADTEAEARSRLIQERLIKASNGIHFFELGLGKIPRARQRVLLRHPLLAAYRYFLAKWFAAAKHHLTEPEEKLLALTSTTSRSMWISGVSGAVSRITVPWDGSPLGIHEAFERIPTIQDTKKRRALWHSAHDALFEKAGDFAEAEINAVYTDKKIDDELRAFKKPYTATLLAYENTEHMVRVLTQTIAHNGHVAHEFYKLKRLLLRLPHLEPADASAEIGTVKEGFPFEKGIEIVRSVFSGVNASYGDLVERFASEGRIDAYPKKGKHGGAFFSGAHNMPGFVFLNYIDDIGSVTGLAHELGHALHKELAEEQPIFYEDYTISAAEIASTFFEELVLQNLIKNLPEHDRICALHESLLNTIGNVFLSNANFNFELELHTRIRKQGFLPKEEIAALFTAHMNIYRGDAMVVPEKAGYAFIRIPHLRMHFYSYPYAFGKLVSRAMLTRYQSDSSYIKKVEQFLRAGKSDSPENLLRAVGINIDEAFFKEGIATIQNDIIALRRAAGVLIPSPINL